MRIGQSHTPSPIKSAPQLAQSLVPGDYPQVQQDVVAFPRPVLDVLDRYGVMVAVLDDGQTLADSPALRHLTDPEYAQERSEANQITTRLLDQGPVSDLETFAQLATRELRKAGLDFHYGVSNRELTPEQIAERQNIPSEHLSHWKEAFKDLNTGLPPDLYLLPHVYDDGKAIPENRLRSARETTAEYVESSLGLNRAEDRLVLLHQKFTLQNATEVGNYRLVLHEMGHALDHVLDRMVGAPGFGAVHRLTVDKLYENDLKRAETTNPEAVFTTARASENVREYFAEAVEAYLTVPGDPQGEIFRTENSNSGLKERNPELHGYIEQIMTTDFSGYQTPGIPARPLLPDFVPDPDAQVIRL